MNHTNRHRIRARIEALEGRVLMANAITPDPDFADGYGIATAPLATPVASAVLPLFNPPVVFGFGATANSVNALPNGNILVTGTITQAYEDDAPYTSAALEVVELNANGTVDTSFGTDGLVQIPIHVTQPTAPSYNNAIPQPFRVDVQAGGDILLATATVDASGNNTHLVVRLTPSGTVDTSFGTGGLAEYPADATTPATDRIDSVASVLNESDGKIILAGTSRTVFTAVRLDGDGSLDATYGTGGTANIETLSAGAVTAATIQSNDQVVLAGTVQAGSGAPAVLAVARLNADGSRDTTYGINGVNLIPPDPENNWTLGTNQATSVVIQPGTGDAIVGGYDQYGTTSQATLYALTSAGALDLTFYGGTGRETPSLLFGVGGLAVEPDGLIIATGSVPYTQPGGPNRNKLEFEVFAADGEPGNGGGSLTNSGPTYLTALTTTPNLPATAAQTPVIQAGTGDILLIGTGTVPSPSGLTYGVDVEALLSSGTTGPSALPLPQPAASLTGQGYTNFGVYDPTNGRIRILSFEHVQQLRHRLLRLRSHRRRPDDPRPGRLPGTGLRPGRRLPAGHRHLRHPAGGQLRRALDRVRDRRRRQLDPRPRRLPGHRPGPARRLHALHCHLRHPGPWGAPGAGYGPRYESVAFGMAGPGCRSPCRPTTTAPARLTSPSTCRPSAPSPSRTPPARPPARSFPSASPASASRSPCPATMTARAGTSSLSTFPAWGVLLPTRQRGPRRGDPGRHAELRRGAGAGRLRRLGSDRSGGLRPLDRGPALPAGQRRAGGDGHDRHGERRRDPGDGAGGRPLGVQHPAAPAAADLVGEGRGVRAVDPDPRPEAAVAASTASAVPTGPALATSRILPRGLVNQAAPDPGKVA